MAETLKHHGILGMRWGIRRTPEQLGKGFRANSIQSYIAKKKNEKIDKSFKNWKKNTDLKETAIALGKKANIARSDYEKNPKDKAAKDAYKKAEKEYKQALSKNTTFRKGAIEGEVYKDSSRKHLSQAKKIKKEFEKTGDPKLKKQYDDLMSKHAVERDKSRTVVEKYAKRSQYVANLKRTATITVKTAAIASATAIGLKVANDYLGKKGYQPFSSDQIMSYGNILGQLSKLMGMI